MVISVVMDITKGWAKKTSKKEPKSKVTQLLNMKTNKPAKISPFRSRYDGTTKRKWITQKQIRETRFEESSLRRDRKNIYNLETTHVTIDSYGFPVGQYIAAVACDDGLSTEVAVKTLKSRKVKHKTEPLPVYPNEDVFRAKKPKK